MAAASSISEEFFSTRSPEEVIDYAVRQTSEFCRRGYQVQQHTPTAATLTRRYTPDSTWAVPLTIAAAIFLLMIASPGSKAGPLVLLCIIAAIILPLVVTKTNTVTLKAGRDPDHQGGSWVIVVGLVTPELRSYLRAWEAYAERVGG